MLKKTWIIFLLQCCALIGLSQSRLNTTLLRELQAPANDAMVTCYVKGRVESLQKNMAAFNGRVNYAAGNVASVTLPLSQIKSLSQQAYVQRMELLRQHLRVLDDSALRKNDILRIHAGAAPLAQPYTGQDVLIGIIDTGTDINHPDFKNSAGKTRIAYLWDQRLPQAANTPQPYNYGQDWSAAQIDSGLCTHDDYVEMSHGTKVAGVAASNGSSAMAYRGVAPNASLITVAVDFNNPGPTITDALNYILNKAAIIGKPVVINISLGDYFGSHDGKDLQAQMINNMLNNAPGRALVAAAGNAGNIPFHLGYSVSSVDTNFTWLLDPTANINFQVFADSLDFKNVKFSIGAHHPTSFNYKGNIGFNQVDSLLGVVKNDTLKYNGQRIGIVSSSADYSDGVYTLDVNIAADSLNYLWDFKTTGSGKIDSWSFDYVHDSLPTLAQLPAISKYKSPDSLQTICTSFQCSNQVITVGNYVDRVAYTDVTGMPAAFDGTDNDIYYTSSFGPTRDGRTKPEITASGENIATTGALPILTWLIQNYPFAVTQDSLHMTFGGTSAAAPVVTGLAALYFEKNPTATAQQLKQDITNCAKQDAFTQSTPNNRWGYGKLDGFNALTCSNIITGISKNKTESNFSIYPNPTNGQLTVNTELAPVHVKVTDVLGREVMTAVLNMTQSTINVSTLNKGLYFITLEHAGQSSSARFIKE